MEGISLVELKARRQESEARYQSNLKEVQENKEKLKN